MQPKASGLSSEGEIPQGGNKVESLRRARQLRVPGMMPRIRVAILVVSVLAVLSMIALASGFVATAAADAPTCGDVNYTENSDGELEVVSLDQLQCINENHGNASSRTDALSKDYLLTRDIGASVTGTWNGGDGFEPIGDNENKFTGTFDGDNNTISNLVINRPLTDDVGLIGAVDGGTIANVGLEDIDVEGGNFAGGLVGANEGGTVRNSYATGSVDSPRPTTGGLVGRNTGTVSDSDAYTTVTGDTNVGGLVGQNTGSGTVSDSNAFGSVTGDSSVGGLVGENTGDVSASHASGSVEGTDSFYVGGLVGINDGGGEIRDSSATGSVDGIDSTSVGGLAGRSAGDVSESYATGSVNGTDNVGGLVGMNIGFMQYSYATGSVDGTDNVGGLVGNNDGQAGPDSVVRWSYATGSVDGSGSVGGLIGRNVDTVSGSYWDEDTTGRDSSAGSPDEHGLSTDEMQGLNATVEMDDLDFSSTWRPGNGDDEYPALAWYSEFTDTADAFYSLVAGEGTSAAPYEITTVYELQTIGERVGDGEHFALQNDIDASVTSGWFGGDGFDPLGEDGNSFEGTFDGDGYAIADLTIDRGGEDEVGLFGDTSSDSVIRDLRLESPSVTGDYAVGPIAGSSHGTVEKSTVVDGTISTETPDGEDAHLGGLVGVINEGTVELSGSSATVDANDADEVGGIAGDSAGAVERSYFTGAVENGGDEIGGILGDANDGTMVSDTYVAGTVEGTSATGAVVGNDGGSTITDSYWDGDEVGTNDGVGEGDGTTSELSTEEMQRLAPHANMDGFSFESPETWVTVDGYPALAWENVDELTLDDLAADDPTGTAGASATVIVTATADDGTVAEGVEVDVADADGIEDLDGETQTTDENGEATFEFTEDVLGEHTPEFAWADDASVSATATVTVVDETGPVADAGDDQTVDVGETVTFDGSDSTDNDEITDYEWDVDDDGEYEETGPTLEYTFDDPGTYEVELHVSDGAANTDTDTVEVKVEAVSSDGGGGPRDDEGDEDAPRGVREVVDEGETRFEVTDGGDEVTLDVRGADVNRSDDGADGNESASGDVILENVTVDRLSIRLTEDGQREFEVTVREWGIETVESAETTEVDARADTLTILEDTGSSPVGYVEVNHTNPDADVENVTFRFRVRKGYLNETGVGPESVALYRDETDRWNQLPATQVNETDQYYVFEATSPGLSLFTIGSTRPVFDVEEADLDRRVVDVGETVTVDATVRNLGGADGTHEVTLTADGERVAGTDVSVDARSSETVGLTFESGEAGEYELVADEEAAGTLSVGSTGDDGGRDDGREASREDDATAGDRDDSDDGPDVVVLVGLLAAALVVVAALVLWRRRDGEVEEEPGDP